MLLQENLPTSLHGAKIESNFFLFFTSSLPACYFPCIYKGKFNKHCFSYSCRHNFLISPSTTPSDLHTHTHTHTHTHAPNYRSRLSLQLFHDRRAFTGHVADLTVRYSLLTEELFSLRGTEASASSYYIKLYYFHPLIRQFIR
jgi:hypothetical protein